MKMLMVLALGAYCAFGVCGFADAQQAVPPVDTLRAVCFPWRFVPLDSLRTADILPPKPLQGVLVDIAASQRADSAARGEMVKPKRFIPVKQNLGTGRNKARRNAERER